MRVITGIVGGRRLSAPPGLDIRPTGDRLKGAFFSAIQFDIQGRRVLDLFAGSGQLGIEALSRGAASCVFVDESHIAVEQIRQNLLICKLKGSVICQSAVSFLSTTRDRFDLVFIDPPYGEGLLNKTLPLLVSVLSDYAAVVCEHERGLSFDFSQVLGFEVVGCYQSGAEEAHILRKVRE